MGYKGISFTDALEMKGVAKYYPAGEVSAQSLIAGNDMLCLPGDIPGSIKKIKSAIRKKKLNWDDLNLRVKKILAAKYQYGLAQAKPVNTVNLWKDLNCKFTGPSKGRWRSMPSHFCAMTMTLLFPLHRI